MAVVVIFDEGATPERVLEVHRSANTPDFTGRTDAVINPDLSAIDGVVPELYWKHFSGGIVEMTAQEKNDLDAAIAAAADAAMRGEAKANYDGQISMGQALRALVKVLIDEINILRAQHSLPDRTLAQAKTAIQNAIDAGDVDE